MHQFFAIVFLTVMCWGQSIAQNATGAFYGRADVMNMGSNANNYMTELVIKQKGNEVEGIFGYYFKDSYQSFFVRGTYNPRTRVVEIKDLPVLFYKSATRNGIECPMSFIGTLMVSKAGSTINGSFHTDPKYRYTCPELRVSYKIDDEADTDSTLRGSVAGQRFWQPQEEDFVVTNVTGDQSKSLPADVTANAASPKDSTTAQVSMPMTTAAIDSAEIKRKEAELLKKFTARKNSYMKDIVVESDSLRVSFYDNGDIDGDFISVFLNGRPIVVGKELSARAMNLYLSLEPGKDYHELSMFAENLGKIPPNTALMVISDGINRYELYLSSSLTQNAAVRIRRKK